MDNLQHKFEDEEHHVIFVDGKWAVKPTDGSIAGYFETQEEAIAAGYKLALDAGDELFIFNENGELVDQIDPEDDLELSPRIQELIRLDQEGKLTFITRDPSPNVNADERTVHDSL